MLSRLVRLISPPHVSFRLVLSRFVSSHLVSFRLVQSYPFPLHFWSSFRDCVFQCLGACVNVNLLYFLHIDCFSSHVCVSNGKNFHILLLTVAICVKTVLTWINNWCQFWTPLFFYRLPSTMMYLLYRSIVVCKRVNFRSRKLDLTRKRLISSGRLDGAGMKHRFVENGSRVYEDCARKKKKEEKPREDLDSAVELHEMCNSKRRTRTFYLGFLSTLFLYKKKYVQVTNRNNGTPIITFFLFACLFQKEKKGARKSSGSTVVLAENLRSSDETECTSVPVVAISTNGRNRCCRTCGTSADSLRASNVLTAPWKTTKSLTWSVTCAYIILNSRKRSGTESSVLSFDFNFNISTSIVVLSIVARNKASWWIEGRKKKKSEKEKKREEKKRKTIFIPPLVHEIHWFDRRASWRVTYRAPIFQSSPRYSSTNERSFYGWL